MEKKRNKVPAEMSEKTASLLAMMKKENSQTSKKLEELKNKLRPHPGGIPLKEAMELLGISKQGVETIKASNHGEEKIIIFQKTIGSSEEDYIKLETVK